MRFQDKLAVVTGANSGIGRAVALQLLEEGGQVLAVDIEHTEPWPEEFRGHLSSVTADLAEPEAPARVASALAGREQSVRILVNAAGILRIAPFLEVTPTDWDRVLAVNLRGVFFLTQAICRDMVAAGAGGRVVNVSSVHATVSEPNAAPYTASKGGIEAMTRTIATELAPHKITVNCVRPGATATAMSKPIYTDEILAALAERIPLRDVAPPEWIANAICYLASDESLYTTGACLDVDGELRDERITSRREVSMTSDTSTAVVTGAASGIGRATAIHLARAGYRVVIVDIDAEGMAKTLELVEAAGGEGRTFRIDVRDTHELGEMVREIVTTAGSPSLLVNVAGVGVAATVLETSDEDWFRVLEINLTGPFLLTRAILPLMLDRGSGVIINVASVAGVIGIRGRAAYCASKAGLVGLTRAVAADHGADGIRCVAVCPGTVETEGVTKILASDKDPAGSRERMAMRQLDGRMGTADEIAATIAFIASPSGRFFNGSSVIVDGGMTAV